jgi:hypothetical protein
LCVGTSSFAAGTGEPLLGTAANPALKAAPTESVSDSCSFLLAAYTFR